MRRPAVHRDIAAPAALVWDRFVTVARWPEWGPSVRGVQTDVARIALGSTGHVVTIAGVRLPFEVTAFDEGRSWSWRVAGIAATDHRVEPHGQGCRASIAVPHLALPYLAVCALGLRRLERSVA